jgi:2-C-methyl-D-erythritol 4-phosphate cytidylyltransferase
MVEWSIEACRAAGSVGSIVVACPPGHVHELAGRDIGAVEGGATRSQSVANALRAVGTEYVAIHDAARPLVTPELIEDVVAALAANPDASGAIAATPVTDTIKLTAQGCNALSPQDGEKALHPDPAHGCNALTPCEGEKTLHQVEMTLDRERLWAAQTPQVFRVAALREALDDDPCRVAAATDESMLIEATGGKVLIHSSLAENFKVTTPLDLKLAEQLLVERAR